MIFNHLPNSIPFGLQIQRDMRHCIGNHPACIERREASGTRVREIILHPLQKIHLFFVVQPSCLKENGPIKKAYESCVVQYGKGGFGLGFCQKISPKDVCSNIQNLVIHFLLFLLFVYLVINKRIRSHGIRCVFIHHRFGRIC